MPSLRDKLKESKHHLICTNPQCGFRVHENYFEEKTRFVPGICPRCAGAIMVVAAFTSIKAEKAVLDLETGVVKA